MAKMKISGQTQGQLVFSYDIRRGHIDYKKLIPALNKRMVTDGIEAVAEENELDEVMGEVLYRVNEKIFEAFHDILVNNSFTLDMEDIMREALNEVFTKGKEKQSE